MRRRTTTTGFSLVELLIVIAISMLLMGLVLGPVVQSFNLTRRANAMVQAQDTARKTMEVISRDVSQAMFVYDNSNSLMNFPIQQPDGSTAVMQSLYGKIDLILPTQLMHCNNPAHPKGEPRDYEQGDDAWPPCPVCGSDNVESRPKTPLTLSSNVVRYFVGLRYPDANAEPDTVLNPAPGHRDWKKSGPPANGFVLYRVEFNPYDPNLVHLDSDGRPILDDPNFFYDTSMASNGRTISENWKQAAQPLGTSRQTDLVTFEMNANKTAILAVRPSVRFQLTEQNNDTFAPAFITDEASEAPIAIPQVYRASYGAWGTSVGPFNPQVYDVMVARLGSSGQYDTWYRAEWEDVGSGFYDLVINRYDGGPSWTKARVFNISSYSASQSFSDGMVAGEPDVAFMVDPARGEARFDFPYSDVIGRAAIQSMNQQVSLNWGGTEDAPARDYRLSQFSAASSNLNFRPRIVPGSEVVRGPDMSPGLAPDQVRMVRYERVPFNLGDPGRNQYKIDYGMTDNVGDRVGWLKFSSDPDEAIPEALGDGSAARIEVSYKFQCNRDGDIVTGNYTTKTLLTITLGIRVYDRSSGKVQPVEITDKIRVRNLMR